MHVLSTITGRAIVSSSFIVPIVPKVVTNSFDMGGLDIELEIMIDIAAPISTRN